MHVYYDFFHGICSSQYGTGGLRTLDPLQTHTSLPPPLLQNPGGATGSNDRRTSVDRCRMKSFVRPLLTSMSTRLTGVCVRGQSASSSPSTISFTSYVSPESRPRTTVHWRAVDSATTLVQASSPAPTVKKVKFSHTRYLALGPELIPVYRQSARG